MKLSSILSYIRDTDSVDLIGTILMIITISGLVLCGIGVVYVVVKQSNSPVLELRKDEWACTDTYTRTEIQLIGKAMMPKTISECIEYRKK